MTAFLAAVIFVVLAEMGDKTQLLAMALAARYKIATVMAGVLVATLANHLLAVAVGHYLATVIPAVVVQTIAAISFILFGIWTLHGDKLENNEDTNPRLSPFWVVTSAFFLAEMGDKTQLATVSLAAKYQTILPVWLGTTSGMLIADAIGIAFGLILGRAIPERAVKFVAAGVFMFVGFLSLVQALPPEGFRMPILVLAAMAILISFYLFAIHSTAKADDGSKQDRSVSNNGNS
ncbi:MAG: TMEM165/GDT1 family protein [Bacillota bacterium]